MEAAGLIMGEMQMINPKGEVTTFLIDGTVIKEQDPIAINWCDKCERWKPLDFGRYDGAQGLTMIWVCKDCK
jgi:hypothetical protein